MRIPLFPHCHAFISAAIQRCTKSNLYYDITILYYVYFCWCTHSLLFFIAEFMRILIHLHSTYIAHEFGAYGCVREWTSKNHSEYMYILITMFTSYIEMKNENGWTIKNIAWNSQSILVCCFCLFVFFYLPPILSYSCCTFSIKLSAMHVTDWRNDAPFKHPHCRCISQRPLFRGIYSGVCMCSHVALSSEHKLIHFGNVDFLIWWGKKVLCLCSLGAVHVR